MRYRAPFTLYLRSTGADRRVWYASWHDATGHRFIRTTGVENTGSTSKKKAAAEAVRLVGADTRKSTTLEEYARDFYVWGTSSWIKRQHAKGKGFNQQWAQALQAMLVNHVFPKLGTTHMEAFTRPMIERMLIDLPLANQSRNHLLYALRTIFREAEAEGVIPRNPLEHAEPLARQGRKRDVLSLEELRLLFPPTRASLLTVWGHPKYAALFLTMATTGIREGEARAMQWRHVLPNGWITVERAVKEDGTIGPPKNGESRVAALPASAVAVLEWWHEESPFKAPDHLVFFGAAPDRWLNRRTFQDIFNRALDGPREKKGQKKAEPRIQHEGRFLTTHSLRHTYNTLMRRTLPADVLLTLMGHRDSRMSEHYDHPATADRIKALEGNRPAIEAMFQPSSSSRSPRVSTRSPEV